MAYVISDACINCGACVDACPAGSIAPGDEHFEINADTCMDCGACMDSCPNNAIQPED